MEEIHETIFNYLMEFTLDGKATMVQIMDALSFMFDEDDICDTLERMVANSEITLTKDGYYEC